MAAAKANIYTLPLSFGELTLELSALGCDLHVLLHGGDRPHLGCTVLTLPRPSLTGDGSISCTSSVLNAPGHKDELLCRRVAEAISKKNNTTVVCSGGYHKDGITEEQIRELMKEVDDFLESFPPVMS